MKNHTQPKIDVRNNMEEFPLNTHENGEHIIRGRLATIMNSIILMKNDKNLKENIVKLFNEYYFLDYKTIATPQKTRNLTTEGFLNPKYQANPSAIFYNHLIEHLKLNYSPIQIGDEYAQILVLKSNKFGINSIGFDPELGLPPELKDLFTIDYHGMFSSLLGYVEYCLICDPRYSEYPIKNFIPINDDDLTYDLRNPDIIDINEL